jgi:hypothetical protein
MVSWMLSCPIYAKLKCHHPDKTTVQARVYHPRGLSKNHGFQPWRFINLPKLGSGPLPISNR